MSGNQKRPLRVKVSLLIHATEDPGKVLKALQNIFPANYAEKIEVTTRDLQGYYKNPITLLETCIKERGGIAVFLKELFQRLEAEDRAVLSSEFGMHVDSKAFLYIRLDKQEAFCNRIKLCFLDPIHIQVKLNYIPRTLEELEANL